MKNHGQREQRGDGIVDMGIEQLTKIGLGKYIGANLLDYYYELNMYCRMGWTVSDYIDDQLFVI